ncbi:hypothetical protein GCM10009001_32670 [Virgibacillus siamensis]|uniref:Uncharacterized protein n=1 Tax=Virgibacillus siamensis TaxID=480071 RepID=A0ABN1GJQ7_9BACI
MTIDEFLHIIHTILFKNTMIGTVRIYVAVKRVGKWWEPGTAVCSEDHPGVIRFE